MCVMIVQLIPQVKQRAHIGGPTDLGTCRLLLPAVEVRSIEASCSELPSSLTPESASCAASEPPGPAAAYISFSINLPATAPRPNIADVFRSRAAGNSMRQCIELSSLEAYLGAWQAAELQQQARGQQPQPLPWPLPGCHGPLAQPSAHPAVYQLHP